MITIDSTELNDLSRCRRRHVLRHDDSAPAILSKHFGVKIPDTVKWLRPVERDSPLEFGISMHKAQNVLHGTEDIEATVRHFREVHTDGTDLFRTKARGEIILREYYNKYNDDLYTNAEAEVEFSISLADDIAYQGRLDKVAAINGDLWVVDHKTSAWSVGSILMEQARAGFQIPGYAWACEKKYGECTGVVIDAIFVNKLKNVIVTDKKTGKEVKEYRKSAAFKNDNWFHRYPLHMIDLQIDRWRKNAIDLIRNPAGGGKPVQQFNACFAYNCRCMYFELCHDAERNVEIWLDTVRAKFVSEKWVPVKEEKEKDND